MKPEEEGYEEKSQFAGSQREKLELVKTIVAFANTKGGRLILRKVTCNLEELDSARLDDLVNKYTTPRVHNIISRKLRKGNWELDVAESTDKPHVFTTETSYKDARGKDKSVFYPGQIYVRHSSKTEPATADDLRGMIQEIVGDWLTKIGREIQNFSIGFSKGDNSLPVRLSSDAGALTIKVSDPNVDYPYTAKTLGTKLDKNQNWVAFAAQKLGLKGNPAYCCEIQGADGHIVVRRYNEEAFGRLKQKIEENPDFDPYHS